MPSFRIAGRTLAAGMKKIASITERKNTIPILSCALVRIEDAACVIETTDLDMTGRVNLDIIGRDDAAVGMAYCIDVRLLSHLAKLAGDTVLTASYEPARDNPKWSKNGERYEPKQIPARVTIEYDGGAASYEFYNVYPAGDWPSPAQDKPFDTIAQFDNGRLAQALKAVEQAISEEQTRYYLNGTCWRYKGAFSGHFVATNGHMLAQQECPADHMNPATAGFEYIIPKKAAKLVRALADRSVRIEVNGHRHLRFAFGDCAVTTKTIDGTFPDTDRVIPTEFKHTIEATRENLEKAIRRLIPIHKERGRAIRFHGRQDGDAWIEMRNPDLGGAYSTVLAPWPEECPEFGMSAAYLLAQLSVCGKRAALQIAHSGAPIKIVTDDPGLTLIVMPMRA